MSSKKQGLKLWSFQVTSPEIKFKVDKLKLF